MSSYNANHSKPEIWALIIDLDGTLLDSERATRDVLKEFLAKYGKELDKAREAKKIFGKTMKESSIAIVKDYQLPLTPDQYIREIVPIYQKTWVNAKALPGADRLIKHLHNHGIPLAVASNSSRQHVDLKISYQKGWSECFSVILGSDDVEVGKPSPDIFEEAAKRMGVEATKCLVIEDSLIGVKAANAAKMTVMAVPTKSEAACASLSNFVLHSLLEFQPELWGLPPFEDWIDNALPMEPSIYVNGLYGNGFLREISEEGKSSLPDQVYGIFFGCAQFDTTISNVVVRIGRNQCSTKHQKVIQIFMVDEKNVCAADQRMRLELLGYLKAFGSQGNKFSEDELVEEYKNIARASMDLPVFTKHSQMLNYNLI